MAEWTERKVIELQREGLLLVEDGNHGEYRPRPSEFGTGEVAFIRAADMDCGRVLFETAAKINAHARNRIIKGIGAGGDVLLSHKGTVGKLAFIPLDAPPFVCSPQTTFWRTLNENRIDRRYLYYYMQSDDFHQQLDSRKGETDMADYVSLTAQRELTVVLPDIQVQRSIVRILGTLDDKIDLNRRMNHTLEALARSLFQSWFVDFDPVTAKASGRQPVGMNRETAKLFPAEFEDSVLGPIPRGWQATKWGEVATLEYGKALRNYEHTKAAYRVYGTNGPIGWHSHSLWGSEGIIVGRKGAYRGVHYSPKPFFVIDTAFYLAPKRPISIKWAFHDVSRIDINGMDSGSAIPSTSRDSFYAIDVCLPPEPVMFAFDVMVSPLFHRRLLADQQSRTLEALRDALLPRLLSGELRVKEAEQLVESA